jgi:hypothetical protein
MNSPIGRPWKPTLEMLAAYADGELDCRPECTAYRLRLEAWLLENPKAFAELEAQRVVKKIMAETKPAEPTAAQWSGAWDEINKQPIAGGWGRIKARWLTVAAALGSAAAVLIWFIAPLEQSGQGVGSAIVANGVLPEPGRAPREGRLDTGSAREMAVFQTAAVGDAIVALPVARADEVEIHQVSGSMSGLALVGRMPLAGPMMLLSPHEVEIQSPPATDPGGTSLRITPGSVPFMWTPLPDNKDNDQN